MILAYAGRRARSLGGDEDRVGDRIRRLLAGLRPAAVVGSAADGADLLLLEAALATPGGPAAHVVLPTALDVFRDDSVEEAWRDRFGIVLDEVARREGVVESLELQPGEAAYRSANATILDRAQALAVGDARAAALVIAREGEGEMIADLVKRAELRGVPTLRIDPSVDVESRPRCFIAMPFGKKTDPQRGFVLDCDLFYGKVLVPALEHAQLHYRRADEEIDSGIVLEPMIEWLAEADLVIGDLATGNFNVGWELGLRHLMRPAQTLLIGPNGTTAPFDVSALRHVRYDHDEHGLGDEAAIAGWRALAPFLARAGERADNDSPVGAVMDVRQWGDVRRRAAKDQRWESLRLELSLARDLRDAERMLSVLDDSDGIGDEQLRLLRAEAGVGLVRLGEFERARELLAEIVDADPAVERPDAHVYYAQSLYRPDGAPPEALERAEEVLEHVLRARPSHPEVRALLGAVAKRRLRLLLDDPAAQRKELELALTSYRHDFERNLSSYYEGINVVALGVALARCFGDQHAGARARELLPAVRVAAQLALARPGERFWAAATLAECALHTHLLGDSDDLGEMRSLYRRAGEERPGGGDLKSTLAQLDFLRAIGIPGPPLDEARDALLAGAGGGAL